jgi:protein FRA10AC1
MASTSGLNLGAEAAELDSSFDEEEEDEALLDEHVKAKRRKREKRKDLAGKERLTKAAKVSSAHFSSEVAADEGRRQRYHMLSLNAYDRHKQLVNEYFLYYRGATANLKRDTSRDKTDLDVIRENHRFLWEQEDESELTWGQRLAKRYCQKLFKEYCICDLSRYKENAVAMRWRTEKEVVNGKGQFVCASRKCDEKELLRTWEVNFAYQEDGEKKNALVKVRLCPDCSYKLNYVHKKKEVTRRKEKKTRKRLKKKKRKRRDSSSSSEGTDEEVKEKRKEEEEREKDKRLEKEAANIWSQPVEVEQEKSREEDFSEYLDELFM